MKSFLVLMACFAMASALEENSEENKGRIFYNVNNNMYLGLNATSLWVAAAGLAVVVGAVVVGYYILQQRQGYASYNRYGTEFETVPDTAQYYSQYESRQKRFAMDVAGKMAQLEQAFKKYQVEEAECEMYISCEASQVHRIEENGPLARIVHDILSTFNRAKDGHKWDSRIEGLVQAFEYGTGARQAGSEDPCQPLRNKCFELHAKKSY